MSKKRKIEAPHYKRGDGSVVAVITDNIKKNGKIKGKSKKETKILRGSCVHHFINKKGHTKTNLDVNEAEGTVRCRACGATFSMITSTKDEVKETIQTTKSVVDQAKFLSVALNTGNKSVTYFSQLGAMLALLPKNYRSVAEIAEKQEQLKKKTKKKKTDYAALGNWR